MGRATRRERRGLPLGIVAIALLVASACDRAEGGGTSPSTTQRPETSTVAPPDGTDLQMRPVDRIVTRASPDWTETPLTCRGHGRSLSDCVASAPDDAGIVLPGPEAEAERYVLGPVIVDGADVARATAQPQPGDGWFVSVDLTAEGTTALLAATGAAAGAADPRNRIAIVVGGRIVSAPAVMAPISSGAVVVTSGLTETDAESLAASLTGPE